MPTALPTLLALLLLPQTEPQAALMDEIERTLTLPRDAHPLASYTRHYTFDAPGRVVATYLLPLPAEAPGDCQLLLRDGSLKPCPQAQIRENAERHAKARTLFGEAGTRRWHPARADMLFIFDGGCTQVNVTYDVAARHATAECNGR